MDDYMRIINCSFNKLRNKDAEVETRKNQKIKTFRTNKCEKLVKIFRSKKIDQIYEVE